MSAHLSPEFLADYFHVGAFNAANIQHVGNKSRIHLDGKARGQIHSEMLVSNKHNAIARQDLLEGFADQFSVGVSKTFIRDFPNLGICTAEIIAGGLEVLTPTGEDGCRRNSGVDLACRGRQFERGIGDDATFVTAVSEDASHYLNTPL